MHRDVHVKLLLLAVTPVFFFGNVVDLGRQELNLGLRVSLIVYLELDVSICAHCDFQGFNKRCLNLLLITTLV